MLDGVIIELIMWFWYIIMSLSGHPLSFTLSKCSFSLNLKLFTENFPRADVYSMIAPDLLHQVIKGCFKDHIMTWIEKYLFVTHGSHVAKEILTDIDWQ